MAAGRSVLLTGATGFLGKVVLDELLRRAGELSLARVFVTVRAPDAEAARGRFRREVARSPALARHAGELDGRVEVVRADLAAPGAGLAAEDRSRLAREVSHVVHCAASVEFTLPLAEAAAANVDAALETLELARACRAEAMVGVSTAYATPHRGRAGEVLAVPEELAALPGDPELLHKEILSGRVDEAALLRASGHPNTYTLTKSLAEHLLAARAGDVPLTLLRPSIISASRLHPLPGWIDSQAAFAAFVLLVGSGQLRAVRCDPGAHLDLVPCDEVARRAVDCAFDPPQGLRILHATAGSARSPSIAECRDGIVSFFRSQPVMGGPRLAYTGRSRTRFWLEDALRHRAPTRLAAGWLRLRGRERPARALLRMAERRRSLNQVFPYFTHKSFDFQSSAPLPEDFDPAAYVGTVCGGVHRHLMQRGR